MPFSVEIIADSINPDHEAEDAALPAAVVRGEFAINGIRNHDIRGPLCSIHLFPPQLLAAPKRQNPGGTRGAAPIRIITAGAAVIATGKRWMSIFLAHGYIRAVLPA